MKRAIAIVALIGLAGCAAGPDYNRPLTPAEAAAERADTAWRNAPDPGDLADCTYESVAATAGERDPLMATVDQVHLKDLCLRARAAARTPGD